MSDAKIDWNSTSFEDRVGCLGFLLLVPCMVAHTAGMAWVARQIWSWYPPFGVATPSFMEMVAMLFLVAIVRVRIDDRYTVWTNHVWAIRTVGVVTLPWFTFGGFVLLRWVAS